MCDLRVTNRSGHPQWLQLLQLLPCLNPTWRLFGAVKAIKPW